MAEVDDLLRATDEEEDEDFVPGTAPEDSSAGEDSGEDAEDAEDPETPAAAAPPAAVALRTRRRVDMSAADVEDLMRDLDEAVDEQEEEREAYELWLASLVDKDMDGLDEATAARVVENHEIIQRMLDTEDDAFRAREPVAEDGDESESDFAGEAVAVSANERRWLEKDSRESARSSLEELAAAGAPPGEVVRAQMNVHIQLLTLQVLFAWQGGEETRLRGVVAETQLEQLLELPGLAEQCPAAGAVAHVLQQARTLAVPPRRVSLYTSLAPEARAVLQPVRSSLESAFMPLGRGAVLMHEPEPAGGGGGGGAPDAPVLVPAEDEILAFGIETLGVRYDEIHRQVLRQFSPQELALRVQAVVDRPRESVLRSTALQFGSRHRPAWKPWEDELLVAAVKRLGRKWREIVRTTRLQRDPADCRRHYDVLTATRPDLATPGSSSGAGAGAAPPAPAPAPAEVYEREELLSSDESGCAWSDFEKEELSSSDSSDSSAESSADESDEDEAPAPAPSSPGLSFWNGVGVETLESFAAGNSLAMPPPVAGPAPAGKPAGRLFQAVLDAEPISGPGKGGGGGKPKRARVAAWTREEDRELLTAVDWEANVDEVAWADVVANSTTLRERDPLDARQRFTGLLQKMGEL